MNELFKPLHPDAPKAKLLDISVTSVMLIHVPISEPVTETN